MVTLNCMEHPNESHHIFSVPLPLQTTSYVRDEHTRHLINKFVFSRVRCSTCRTSLGWVAQDGGVVIGRIGEFKGLGAGRWNRPGLGVPPMFGHLTTLNFGFHVPSTSRVDRTPDLDIFWLGPGIVNGITASRSSAGAAISLTHSSGVASECSKELRNTRPNCIILQ